MVEVELKYPAAWGAIEGKLRELQARHVEDRREADRYFNAPDRDFAKTDEALRIRQIDEKSTVTYKGPRRDSLTKTRTEIEAHLEPGPASAADLAQILTHLGYRAVAGVSKQRRVYEVAVAPFGAEICFDEVEGVGSYVELEIVAPKAQVEQARSVLLQLAKDLALEGSERRSYLELLLERQGGKT